MSQAQLSSTKNFQIYNSVGRAKAIVAAEFITNRVEEAKVTPHYCRIEEKDSEFYRQFQIVILGLDSVQARRWINAKMFSLLIHDDDGKVLPESIRPIIDGGTEGFRAGLGNLSTKNRPIYRFIFPEL